MLAGTMAETRVRRATPGRPRSTEVDREIVAAALRLLRERGPVGVTIEAVAQYSGSAKTTIYRRYADRTELLRATLAFVQGIPELPPHLPVRQCVTELLARFRFGIEEVVGVRSFAALLNEGDDPEFSQAFRTAVLQPRIDVILRAMRAGVAAGELRDDVDLEAVVFMLAGSYFTQAAVHGSVPPDWAEKSVAIIWPAIATPPG